MVTDASSSVAQLTAPAKPTALPDHMEEINDDPSWYTYNDAYDGGRYGGSIGKAPQQQAQMKAPAQDESPIDAPQDGDDELAAGIFGN
jgi:hypothetical protein